MALYVPFLEQSKLSFKGMNPRKTNKRGRVIKVIKCVIDDEIGSNRIKIVF